MQYLLVLYSDQTSWPKLSTAEQETGVAAYMAYSEALVAAGAMKGSNRLQPSSTATTVRMSNGKSQVLDGPYIDSKEQLAGYFLIDVADLDAALSWAARCPGASHGVVEVRPVWGPASPVEKASVVAINRALAMAELQGGEAALQAMPDPACDARLLAYQPYWAARAELLAKTGARGGSSTYLRNRHWPGG